ncbi:hypothetical protein ACMD2_21614 [Ananas comosus]|uniref:Uncharacterized protein n=1 Tax=Ananas comosus TaxID=4615 RepID=A0A199VKI0_ANACO|nr:hypothetical protein ACMD2_21614 [Ananas comosus]
MTLSHHQLLCFSPPPSPLRPQKLFSPSPHSPPPRLSLPSNPNLILSSSSSTPSPLQTLRPRPTTRSRVSIRGTEKRGERDAEEGDGALRGFEESGAEGGEVVFEKTLRLVECAMFASVAGLAYFLSNSLAIENYFGCFFSLPIVISSMRWGVAAGRKTMVATALLLLTLSGPVKASTYLLMHGLVGFAMGSLWRLGANWVTSIFLCSIITINIHASLTYILTAIGVNVVPTMDAIYLLFGTLLLLNCGFFVFLLHILYAVILTKLGLRASLKLPKWLDKAI